jgi:hypothetical protein
MKRGEAIAAIVAALRELAAALADQPELLQKVAAIDEALLVVLQTAPGAAVVGVNMVGVSTGGDVVIPGVNLNVTR